MRAGRPGLAPRPHQLIFRLPLDRGHAWRRPYNWLARVAMLGRLRPATPFPSPWTQRTHVQAVRLISWRPHFWPWRSLATRERVSR